MSSSAPLQVTFGDVVRHRAESTSDPSADGLTRLVALEHLEPGFPYLRRWSAMPAESSFSRRFRAGQVLFAKRRVYQRKAALAPFDGMCSGDLLVFEADERKLLPDLLPFLVQSEAFMQHAEKTSAGSLSPRTKWKDLATFQMQLPPLDEQRRIAGLLRAATQDVIASEQALTAARTARTAMCAEYFEQGLVNGKVVQLDDVLERSQYGLSVKASADGGIPILGMGQMLDGRMTTAGAGFVTLAESELDAYRLHPNDILFNRTNSIEHVGRVALNELDEDVVFASYLIRLTVDESVVLPRYLYEYLGSRPGQRRIRRFISRGVSQANINATNLKSIDTPLPTLDAQRDLVGRVEELARLTSALVERHRASRTLLATLIERELGLGA